MLSVCFSCGIRLQSLIIYYFFDLSQLFRGKIEKEKKKVAQEAGFLRTEVTGGEVRVHVLEKPYHIVMSWWVNNRSRLQGPYSFWSVPRIATSGGCELQVLDPPKGCNAWCSPNRVRSLGMRIGHWEMNRDAKWLIVFGLPFQMAEETERERRGFQLQMCEVLDVHLN